MTTINVFLPLTFQKSFNLRTQEANLKLFYDKLFISGRYADILRIKQQFNEIPLAIKK